MLYVADPVDGSTIDARETMYPAVARFVRGRYECPHKDVTVFGYSPGRTVLTRGASSYGLAAGGFFALTGEFHASADGGLWIVEKSGYRGMCVVGEMEPRGRLTYIDGCSDSMLVPPPRLGDPVLNHLHFPAGVVQTQHTHPSIRMGYVARGTGFAWRGASGSKMDAGEAVNRYAQHIEDGKPEHEALKLALEQSVKAGDLEWGHVLHEGGMFLLPEHELHSFCTLGTGMDIVAWHPDSDWGPTDEVHPMLNRTHVRAGGAQ